MKLAVLNREKFNNIRDSIITINKKEYSVKGLLESRFIVGHLERSKEIDNQPLYSAILFGPPGTAKTTIVEAIASALGWPYVYLQPADFLNEGIQHTPGRMQYVFRRLMELDSCVILFDEFEQFARVRDSDTGNVPFESQMITTTILAPLLNLRNKRAAILFCATNDLEAIDPAVRREGRFDAELFIPPPSLKEKLLMCNELFEISGLGKRQAKQLDLYREFTKDNFEGKIEYFTYAEWQRCIRDVIALCRKGLDDDKLVDELSHILSEQLSVIINCEDSEVRKRFKATRLSSRLTV